MSGNETGEPHSSEPHRTPRELPLSNFHQIQSLPITNSSRGAFRSRL
jgi:hypothetical protein